MTKRTNPPRHGHPWSLDTPRSTIGAKRTKRGVRLSVVMKPDLTFTGPPNAATFAYADISDEQFDRLVRRLVAIRGGERALP